ncbi:VOC family protein [Niastella caeni]|uniref:VOC family protein n=1 Tax=Niastella caeni TaxID=2569763 RepID=A0A4S8I1F4_9BACT|nr:VOC family protein [Niastella caeni]THU41973.1 VOC family protein [Niastella caeni]
MTSAISWFEIPVLDLNRAQQFYEAILGVQLIPMDDFPNIKMRMFPIDDPMTGIGGALVHTGDSFFKPSSTEGPLIYLNANPDVQRVLDKVEAAGGKVIIPKTEISPEYGHMGVFIDSEGNRIGIHSVPAMK